MNESRHYSIRSLKNSDGTRRWAVHALAGAGEAIRQWEALSPEQAAKQAPELAKILALIPDGTAPGEQYLSIAPTGHLDGRRFCTVRSVFFDVRTPFDVVATENGCALSQPAAQAAAPNLSAALNAYYGTEAVLAPEAPTAAEKGLQAIRQAMRRPEVETPEQQRARLAAAKEDRRQRALAILASALGGEQARAVAEAIELLT